MRAASANGTLCRRPTVRGRQQPFRADERLPKHRRRSPTGAMLEMKGMDKSIRKYASFEAMKADEYRYWQSRPVHERMDAVEEMNQTAYALKGWEMEPDVPRLQRPFVRLPCPWR